MTERLVVTITITRGDVKLLQLVHPAEATAQYELHDGIDLGDGRLFYGYEFEPWVGTAPLEDPE